VVPLAVTVPDARNRSDRTAGPWHDRAMSPDAPVDGPDQPSSDRVRLRRGAHLGRYGGEDVRGVLDAGVIAHVGVVTPDGPIVIPMAYGRDETHLYLHGAAGNAALRAADGQDVCVTVTVLDGLIFGRAAFHNSMRYRSVVVRGRARRLVEEAEQIRGLRIVSDHVVANWDTARPVAAAEVRQTMVVTVPLDEASAKVRDGGPIDEIEDVDGPHWGGAVPITTTFDAPVDAADLRPGIHPRPAIEALAGRRVHERDRR
jgi:nitroimidazol reductase NimA-like FMN-containing flavoprotein (pyridoxamine 5'-phosphate oxidase superfamily)